MMFFCILNRLTRISELTYLIFILLFSQLEIAWLPIPKSTLYPLEFFLIVHQNQFYNASAFPLIIALPIKLISLL